MAGFHFRHNMVYLENMDGHFVLTATAYILLQSHECMLFFFKVNQVLDESPPDPHVGTDSPLLSR